MSRPLHAFRYRIWADLALAMPSLGAPKTLEILEAAATATCEEDIELSVEFWLAWLGLTVRSSEGDAEAVDAAYDQAITAVPGAVESARLWDSRINYCLMHRARDAVRDAFTKAIVAASTVAWEVGTDARSIKVRTAQPPPQRPSATHALHLLPSWPSRRCIRCFPAWACSPPPPPNTRNTHLIAVMSHCFLASSPVHAGRHSQAAVR